MTIQVTLRSFYQTRRASPGAIDFVMTKICRPGMDAVDTGIFCFLGR